MANVQHINPGCGGLLLLVLLTAGCEAIGPGSRVTPQVCGRVVDAETHRPLAGVKVLRVLHGRVEDPDAATCGAESMRSGRPAATDAGGQFEFGSKSYFALLSQSSWWTLRLSFQAAGYAAWQTNFSLADVVTNLPDGTPLVEAGDILLKPLPK